MLLYCEREITANRRDDIVPSPSIYTYPPLCRIVMSLRIKRLPSNEAAFCIIRTGPLATREKNRVTGERILSITCI